MAVKNMKTMTLVKFNKHANRGLSPLFPSLFNDFFEGNFPELRNGGSALPSVNISESDKEFHLELSIPGFGKDEINLSLDENTLVVSGEKKEEKTEQEKRYTRKEFSFQNFKRSFTLPDNIAEDAISAKFEHGILKIDLPKKETQQKIARKIELQ